jgi:transcriptional regulator with XRE-family HTH domain
MALLTAAKAQKQLAEQMRTKRLAKGLTQEGLAVRADVSLSTLRKFEQKGVLSLESFLKLSLVLGDLERVVDATKLQEGRYASIDDVLADGKQMPKKGWKK